MTAAENRTLDALRTSGPEPDDVLHPECEGRRRQGARERVAAHELTEVALTVNGTEVTVRVPARMHLADALREHLGLTGTHLGCEHGVCGMCTVLVDGLAARACLLFAVQCDGPRSSPSRGSARPTTSTRCSRPSPHTTVSSAASARRGC